MIKLSGKYKKTLIILAVVLIFIITLVSAFFAIVKIGEIRLRNSLTANESIAPVDNDEGENTVYHNGTAYVYNDKLINILLIGVDAEKNTKTEQGQADALYLASIDTENSNVSIVSISRNTLCEFDVLGVTGESVGTEKRQICLAYAYGKDDYNSSKNCVNAVSRLLYEIPINGFYTIHFETIAQIVDSVGGVKITVPSDVKNTFLENKIGQTVTLNGNDSLAFLRYRSNSNAPRVEHHKNFIKSFVNSAKAAVKKDISLPFKMANKLSDDAVTNLDISNMIYLATEALNWKLDFVDIKGEYSIENNLEIFTVNEESLKDTVVDNFYIEK